MADGTQLNVEQTNGQMVGVKNNPKRRFKHDGIPPSSKECCPKDNINCCKGWYDTHHVEFQVSYVGENRRSNIRAIKGMCGGYIVFKGTFKNITYDNFGPGDVLLESQSWNY
ncbi:hypothetical protein INT45_001638 [Circinella minor]|uniref:Uncharacterized protein n=1 Tax=Circinella minor TaxID=1195481 RepID=A0A8H7VKJ8_9FUNG|nr:hypothetical protein INT45_001638 [Circinella minor]